MGDSSFLLNGLTGALSGAVAGTASAVFFYQEQLKFLDAQVSLNRSRIALLEEMPKIVAPDTRGSTGTTIISGELFQDPVPGKNIGKTGDYFIDKNRKIIYGPKEVSGWNLEKKISLQGPSLKHGVGEPEALDSLYQDGDFYIDTDEVVLYGPYQSGGSWPEGVSLRVSSIFPTYLFTCIQSGDGFGSGQCGTDGSYFGCNSGKKDSYFIEGARYVIRSMDVGSNESFITGIAVLDRIRQDSFYEFTVNSNTLFMMDVGKTYKTSFQLIQEPPPT